LTPIVFELTPWLRRDPLLWNGKLPVRDKHWLEGVNKLFSAEDLS
jgi:hypothetical protein